LHRLLRPFVNWLLKGAAELRMLGWLKLWALSNSDVYNNPNVTTVAPFAAALRELAAQGRSGITDAGLAQAAGIVKLDVDRNPNVGAGKINCSNARKPVTPPPVLVGSRREGPVRHTRFGKRDA
jgi:hypothetical protein